MGMTADIAACLVASVDFLLAADLCWSETFNSVSREAAKNAKKGYVEHGTVESGTRSFVRTDAIAILLVNLCICFCIKT